jgi:uncharacterized delta-60 repeat protein
MKKAWALLCWCSFLALPIATISCSGDDETQQQRPPGTQQTTDTGSQPGTPPGTGTQPGIQPPGGGNDPPPVPPATGQPASFNGGVAAIWPVPNSGGDIYVAGPFTQYGGTPIRPVIRLQPDGAVSSAFKLASVVESNVTNIALADDGSGDVYISTITGSYPALVGRLRRVNPDGTVDLAFPQQEFAMLNPPASWIVTHLRAITALGDGSGRLLVGGDFNTHNGTPSPPMVRLNVNGSLDSSFHYTGVPLNDLYPIADGDVYVINWTSVDIGDIVPNRLHRINGDGSEDTGFVPFNVFVPFLDRANIRSVVPLRDGDVMVGGQFVVNYNPTGPINPLFDESASHGIARLNPDGSHDFDQPRPGTGIHSVYGLALLQNGQWYVARRDEASGFRLLRYNSNGIPDTTFTAGTITADVNPQSQHNILILPLSDGTGDVYLGGYVSQYNGRSIGSLVRLNADGSFD